MTVQVSVTVWTILCFLALMLILDRLLFRPLLSFMDARREKVDRAREEKETALRERDAELQRREEERLSAEKHAAQEAAAALEELRRTNVRAAAEKKADNEARLARQRLALEQESQAIQTQLAPRMGELAAIFAQRLQAWQENGTDDADDETAAPRADAPAVNSAPVNGGAATI